MGMTVCLVVGGDEKSFGAGQLVVLKIITTFYILNHKPLLRRE